MSQVPPAAKSPGLTKDGRRALSDRFQDQLGLLLIGCHAFGLVHPLGLLSHEPYYDRVDTEGLGDHVHVMLQPSATD